MHWQIVTAALRSHDDFFHQRYRYGAEQIVAQNICGGNSSRRDRQAIEQNAGNCEEARPLSNGPWHGERHAVNASPARTAQKLGHDGTCLSNSEWDATRRREMAKAITKTH
jgi:hypothetical protein